MGARKLHVYGLCAAANRRRGGVRYLQTIQAGRSIDPAARGGDYVGGREAIGYIGVDN